VSLSKKFSFLWKVISTKNKLGNERFVAGAPEQVVVMERKKLADAEAKIKALEARLKELKG
jgi:valyl-tRNA synthetase